MPVSITHPNDPCKPDAVILTHKDQLMLIVPFFLKLDIVTLRDLSQQSPANLYVEAAKTAYDLRMRWDIH